MNQRGWPIETKLNKYYVGFNWGRRVCFAVVWGGTHAWKISLALAGGPDMEVRTEHWEFQRYDAQFHQVILRPLTPEEPEISDIVHLFDAAYAYIEGRR